jgi:hypothetical protein
MIFLLLINQVFATCLNLQNISSNLNELNRVTIDDTKIVTEDDLLFCPEQAIQNADISPQELPDDGSLWRVGNNRWNDDWEKKYQLWVGKNFNKDFFKDLNLATDCADAVIALRSIFSRIYNLPINFNPNAFANSNKSYAPLKSTPIWDPENWKNDFKNDLRFQKSLKDVMNKIGTINLHQYTYPIQVYDNEYSKINSSVAPGTIKLAGGHTEIIIFKENSLMPFRTYSSTMPQEVRELSESMLYPSNPSEDEDEVKGTGFLWWNWGINCKGKFKNVEDEKMPYYSNQQITKGFKPQSPNYIYQRGLAISNSEKKNLVGNEITDAMARIDKSMLDRSESILKAQEICKLKGINSAASCYSQENTWVKITDDGFGYKNEKNEFQFEPWSYGINTIDYYGYGLKPKSKELESFYHTYSTPNRDEKIIKDLNLIQDLKFSLQDFEDTKAVDLMLLGRFIELPDGKKISYFHFWQAKAQAAVSFQPWDSIDKRWGTEFLIEYKKKLIDDSKQYFSKINENEMTLSNPESTTLEKEDAIKEIERIRNQYAVLFKEIEVLREIN